VDPALHLFRITRIIASTLENLYTTTRRRGGVAKINQLQAELDMWARGIPRKTSTEVGRWRPGSESFAGFFLQVVLCIATIHVHRPALSFTKPDPQITASLQRCNEASITLINLLAASLSPTESGSGDSPIHPDGVLLGLLYPGGAHMLWHAGVNILYAHWKSRRLDTSEHTNRQDTREDDQVVQRCVQALRRLSDLTAGVKLTNGEPNRLDQCASILERLRKKTFPPSSEPTVEGSHSPVTTPAASLRYSDSDGGSWDVGSWPMESVLEFANSMDVEPLSFFPPSPIFGFQ
jgi:hypothetical protein